MFGKDSVIILSRKRMTLIRLRGLRSSHKALIRFALTWLNFIPVVRQHSSPESQHRSPESRLENKTILSAKIQGGISTAMECN